jgi:threonine/homoserine/homoserine lactone efflux protein
MQVPDSRMRSGAFKDVGMIDLNHFLAFLFPVVAISLVPGPDTVYVLNRSISQGRLAGVTAALGSANGVLGHILLSVVGLSALLMTSTVGLLVVRIFGAVYLIYLGVNLLRNTAKVNGQHILPADRLRTVWVQGVLTNILNPKVALFFLAFIPQFIDIHRGHIPIQCFSYGIIFDVIGTSWLCTVALLSGALSSWFRTHPFAVTCQQKVTGAIFIAFAAKLALPL